MSRHPLLSVAGIGALSMIVSCAKSSPGAPQAQRQAPRTAAVIGNACDGKLLTVADAATVISEPITATEPIAGDAQSCQFKTASFSSVLVTVRPGAGKASVAVWKSGQMPVSGTAISGVGDEAVWVNSLTEVVAERNNLLCDIQVTGLAGVLNHQPAAAKQRAIGALCNKVFAAAR